MFKNFYNSNLIKNTKIHDVHFQKLIFFNKNAFCDSILKKYDVK